MGLSTSLTWSNLDKIIFFITKRTELKLHGTYFMLQFLPLFSGIFLVDRRNGKVIINLHTQVDIVPVVRDLIPCCNA
jgi:hypothetical protein